MTGPTTGSPVLRFAPSPNGPLHLGHALSALVGFDMARRLGGPLPRAHRGHRRRALPRGASSPASSRISPGSASRGRSRCCASRSTSPSTRRPRNGWRRRGCSIPALPRAPRSWRRPRAAPLDPGRSAALSGPAQAAVREPRSRSASATVERFALRLDMERALEAAERRLGGRPLTFTELDAEGHPTDDRGAAGALGGRGHPAQGRAGELSSGRRRRRCAPGRHPRHPRPRPLRRDRHPPPAAGPARACRSRSTTTTGCSRTRRGASLPKARGTPAWPACGPPVSQERKSVPRSV